MKQKNPVLEQQRSPYVHVAYPLLILIAVSIILYIRSLNFGLTQLDDSIFVKDFHDLLSKGKNFGHLFFRGVFMEKEDTYYRPILMVSFMFNSIVSGKVFGYHVTNLVFHLVACVLLYAFFIKLKFRTDVCFILALLFSVHPVLSQAVVWIPGRNDSMLTAFALAGILCLIQYIASAKWHWILLHFVFLFLTLYTKESGVILPVMCFAYLFFLTKTPVKTYLIFIVGWAVIGLTWLYMRSISIDPNVKPTAAEYATGFVNRLPLFIQYIGKSLLPFNLSVFPMQADTSMIYGSVAVILLTVLLFLNKTSDKKLIVFGLGWYVLFLLPALFVPAQINEQAFEHRLYLPIIGIFILLQQTIVFAEDKIPNQKIVFWSAMAVAVLFFVINIGHQQKFKNEITFWENAAQDSPSSSYAHKLLGVKYYDKNKFDASMIEIKEALRLDSTERYANYYYAKLLFNKNNNDTHVEYYLLKEEKLHPGFIDNVFELAKINFTKGDKAMAEYYLEESVKVRPTFMSAKNNLILLLLETGQKEKAKEKINQWKADKTGIPDGIEKMVNEALLK